MRKQTFWRWVHTLTQRKIIGLYFDWYEMCDAVQAEKYTIDEIEVSNFVLPLYFTKKEESGGTTISWEGPITERH